MQDDAELLRCYAETRSDGAFAALVERHLTLVYATALRLVAGDTHLAQDVAQTVFTDLARKAAALADRRVLAGWLYTSARYAAAKAVRTARRRQIREQEAHLMQELTLESVTDGDWARLRPVIDEALQSLNERDREAVLLRFFEGHAFPEVGRRLAVSDDAARLRVERALEKMRVALKRHGLGSTTAALALALANQPVVAAPAGLALTITGAVLAGAAGGGSAGAALAFLTMSKLSMGIAAVIVVAGLATAVLEGRANWELRAEIGALQATQSDTDRLQQDNRQLNATLQKLGATNPEADELARLRARVALLKARPEGATDEQMTTAAAWRNVGRATPLAAVETFLWATSSGDIDATMRGYVFPDEMKASLAAFFAQQSETVRTRYGTPERLLGELWKAEADALAVIPVASQVVDVNRSIKSEADTAKVRIWYRRATGEEKGTTIEFQRGDEGWGMVGKNYSEEQYAKLATRIDQATGALHYPGK